LKIVFFSFLLLGFLIVSCDEKPNSEDFLKVYGKVLMARVENINDIKAQYAVDSVLAESGYTLSEFRQDLEIFATQDPEFNLKIDSLRNTITEAAQAIDKEKTDEVIMDDNADEKKLETSDSIIQSDKDK